VGSVILRKGDGAWVIAGGGGCTVTLQLEIASRGNTGDLVQLWDGSRVRMRGLDRKWLSLHPADWCREP
jgi:hypothetical protein